MDRHATSEETASFKRRMKRKAGRILVLEARALEKREQVNRAARRQVRDKQAFLSGNFLKAWRTGFDFTRASDQHNRSSDRQLPVRSYSLVDNDVWHMTEMRRWFDAHSSLQKSEGFDPLVSGYTFSADQKDALPPLLRIQRVPTPAWAVAQDQSALAVSQKKLDKIAGLRELQDRHFFDFEGNLQIQRARTAVLASQLDAPKGWGPQHTHVAGFRSPPWKERPPQEDPRYRSLQSIRERDLFVQAGGGLETYNTKRAETRWRTDAMHAGSGIFDGVQK